MTDRNRNKKKGSSVLKKILSLMLGSYIQGGNACSMWVALDLHDDPNSCVH